MNWFKNFYERIDTPFLIAADPLDNYVIKTSASIIGREFWRRTKRAERVLNGLKQRMEYLHYVGKTKKI